MLVCFLTSTVYAIQGHEEGDGAYLSCIWVKAEYTSEWVAISSKCPMWAVEGSLL